MNHPTVIHDAITNVSWLESGNIRGAVNSVRTSNFLDITVRSVTPARTVVPFDSNLLFVSQNRLTSFHSARLNPPAGYCCNR
jgi:hypothetical protein